MPTGGSGSPGTASGSGEAGTSRQPRRGRPDAAVVSRHLPLLRIAARHMCSRTSACARSPTRSSPRTGCEHGAVLSRSGRSSASSCFLVQSEEFESPEGIFSDYTYFSSYSTSWLAHAASYADQMVERLGLGERPHRGRGRLERRLPPPVLRSDGASACSASSRRRTSPRRPSSRGIPTVVRLLRRAGRARSSRPTRRPTS